MSLHHGLSCETLDALLCLTWEHRFAPVPASLSMREVVKGSHGLYAIRTHPASASAAPPVHYGRRDGDWCRPCRCLVGLPAGQAWPQGRAGGKSPLTAGETLWWRAQLENGAFAPLCH